MIKCVEIKIKTIHCVKSVQIRSFFWSVFPRIRAEYREIRNISLYSVRMRENTEQKKLRIWTFLTQWFCLFTSILKNARQFVGVIEFTCTLYLCHISFLLMTLNLLVRRYWTPHQFSEHHILAYTFVVAEWASQSSNHQMFDPSSVWSYWLAQILQVMQQKHLVNDYVVE